MTNQELIDNRLSSQKNQARFSHQIVIKKNGLIVSTRPSSKMLPQFYQSHLQKYLSETQLITLKLLVWLLQSQKQVKIERLAATLPLPIQQNSRRRHIQRFLSQKRLSVVLLWFPLIQQIIARNIGDREFHSVELAHWLHRQRVKFVFRQKQDTTFRQNRQKFKPLSQLEIFPGMKQFLANINLTQKKGFGRFNLAIYWKRKYKSKQEQAPWYLLTNLPNCETAVKIYGKRFGIEAMFKDCKTGGYNLEGSQTSSDRLVRLVLLIALAMSAAWLQGQHTSNLGKSSYICRQKETHRTRRRHSNFWIGLYGYNWIAAFHECQDWVEKLITSVRNKRAFYQRGVRAITLIQEAF